MKTTKGGKVMNPTDAYRKELRKKELKRNKKERKKVREVGILKKDPEAIKEQIRKLEMMKADGALDKTRRHKKRQLEDTLNLVLKKRKEYEEKMREKGEEPVMFSHLPAPRRRATAEEEERAKHPKPEDSVYFHPTLNPTGAPPPGKPPMYKSSIGPRIPLSGTGAYSEQGTLPLPPLPPPPPLPACGDGMVTGESSTPLTVPVPPPPPIPLMLGQSLPPPPGASLVSLPGSVGLAAAAAPPPPPPPPPPRPFQPPPPGTADSSNSIPVVDSMQGDLEEVARSTAQSLSRHHEWVASRVFPSPAAWQAAPRPLEEDDEFSAIEETITLGEDGVHQERAPLPPPQPPPPTRQPPGSSSGANSRAPAVNLRAPPLPSPNGGAEILPPGVGQSGTAAGAARLQPPTAVLRPPLSGSLPPPPQVLRMPLSGIAPAPSPPPVTRAHLGSIPPGPPSGMRPPPVLMPAHVSSMALPQPSRTSDSAVAGEEQDKPSAVPSYVRSAAATVVKRPLAQHTPELTSMVPASVRVRRENMITKAKPKAVVIPALVPTNRPTPARAAVKSNPIYDSYSAFLEDMKALGAFDEGA